MLTTEQREDNYRRQTGSTTVRPGKQARRIQHKQNAQLGDAPKSRLARRNGEPESKQAGPEAVATVAETETTTAEATCATCNVPLGDRCKTASGNRASKQHAGNQLAA